MASKRFVPTTFDSMDARRDRASDVLRVEIRNYSTDFLRKALRFQMAVITISSYDLNPQQSRLLWDQVELNRLEVYPKIDLEVPS